MKISIIREFVRLSETKNYTKTAEELYISQSVLSRHIASLEEELGTQLISRSRTSFTLTEAGEAARKHFVKILDEYQSLLGEISEMNGDEEGRLDVGVLYYDYSAYVEKIRRVFHEHCPKIRLHLHSYQPEQIEEDLLNRRIDAAFLYGVKSLKRDDIRTSSFLRVPLTIMYDRSHRLASLENIRIADLNGEKILWPDCRLQLSQTSGILRDLFRENHVRMSEYISFSNFDDVPFLLAETGGIFISPMANMNAYPGNVECRYLGSGEYRMDISTVWRSDCDNRAIRHLLQAVRITYP